MKYRKKMKSILSSSDPHQLIFYLTDILTIYLAFYLIRIPTFYVAFFLAYIYNYIYIYYIYIF